MNRICLVGRLGADPLIKRVGETTIAELRLATNRRVKEGTEWKTVADWHSVTVFGKPAEWLAERGHKGAIVEVVGELTYRTYTTKDGQERTATEVKSNEASVLAPSANAAPPVPEQDRALGAQRTAPTRHETRRAPVKEETDDIPF